MLLNVLLTKMVADWFAELELATAMGILAASWPLGIGLALVLLGPLSVITSWSFAVLVTACACTVAMVCVAAVYRRPDMLSSNAANPALSGWLSQRELALACLAGTIWALYNVAYIIVVSFSPLLLAKQGFNAANASVVVSFATWPLIATVLVGGLIADRTRRGHEIMVGCFVAMAVSMPLMLAAPSPLIVLAIIGALTGPAAGIIMALPTRTLSLQSRHAGMGIFYTFYYAGMALLPSVAGWFRDISGIDSAPLLFGSSLLFVAAACAMLFRRLEGKAAALAS